MQSTVYSRSSEKWVAVSGSLKLESGTDKLYGKLFLAQSCGMQTRKAGLEVKKTLEVINLLVYTGQLCCPPRETGVWV